MEKKPTEAQKRALEEKKRRELLAARAAQVPPVPPSMQQSYGGMPTEAALAQGPYYTTGGPASERTQEFVASLGGESEGAREEDVSLSCLSVF